MTDVDATRTAIEGALASLNDPNSGVDYVASKSVKQIDVNGDSARIELRVGYPAATWIPGAQLEIAAHVKAATGLGAVEVIIESEITSHAVQKGVQLLPGVKNIIAVASGKGGVGKSTCSVNIALALAAEGASVGLLDADIYGPSQPRMLGITGKPKSADGKKMDPMENFGIKAMSIGFLIDEETPMIWRGPMVTQALEQLLKDTNWGDLDYLIVDMPPGTGDTQLTLAQKVPVTGAVIVTTPQDIALLDARKAYKMFEKVEIPVLGVVENMSVHICSSCGHEEHIFGTGGGKRMAEQYGVDALGDVPLDIAIRENVDNGHPTVVAAPDSAITKRYHEIARRVGARVALQKRDHSSVFPSITIQNT